MEIFDETKFALRDLWDDNVHRQNIKILLTHAIGNATDISVKQTIDVLDELDLLLKREDDETKHKEQGLWWNDQWDERHAADHQAASHSSRNSLAACQFLQKGAIEASAANTSRTKPR